MSHQSVTGEFPTTIVTHKKLTTANACELAPPSGKADHIVWDENFPGFGVRLRVGRNGISRMWVYQYDYAGCTRRKTLGNVSGMGIEDARKSAGKLQGKVRLGHDPVREIAEKRELEAVTFASVMKTYLAAVKLELRTRTWKDTERFLKVHCKPLHPLPFTAITRKDIAAVLTPIGARGKHATSNGVRSKLGALFNWAITQGLTENNPVNGTKKYELEDRSRVLSMAELVAIWHTVGDMPIDVRNISDYAAIIRLLMLTGCRRMEIGGLRWGEVRDGETFIDDGLTIAGPSIVLPPERVKNGCKHIVPLSKPAHILLTRPRGPDDGFVLRRKSKVTEVAWSHRKKLLDAALIARGHTLAPWVLHDIRRSVATHMGEMGIEPHVIEKVLNHTLGGVAGKYNKSKLEKQKRQVLEAWAEVLMAQVEGREPADNVVPVPQFLGRLR